MAAWYDHPILTPVRASHFKYSSTMWPCDFAQYYRDLPIPLDDGSVKRAKILTYVSGFNGERNKAYHAFKKPALAWAKKTGDADAADWLDRCSIRVGKCFYGQGMPCEIATICRLAVACGYKTALEVGDWAGKTFGQDCCGFVSNYYTAIDTFDGMMYYIPQYRVMAGTAYEVSDISYDCAVMWARKKAAKEGQDEDDVRWEVTPNGPGAHVAVTEDWVEYGKSLNITQRSGSALSTQVYEIVSAPKGRQKDKAVWKIRPKGGGGAATVMITRLMPYWMEAPGK